MKKSRRIPARVFWVPGCQVFLEEGIPQLFLTRKAAITHDGMMDCGAEPSRVTLKIVPRKKR